MKNMKDRQSSCCPRPPGGKLHPSFPQELSLLALGRSPLEDHVLTTDKVYPKAICTSLGTSALDEGSGKGVTITAAQPPPAAGGSAVKPVTKLEVVVDLDTCERPRFGSGHWILGMLCPTDSLALCAQLHHLARWKPASWLGRHGDSLYAEESHRQ